MICRSCMKAADTGRMSLHCMDKLRCDCQHKPGKRVLRRSVCSVCGRGCAYTKNGGAYWHKKGKWMPNCDGAGKPVLWEYV